MSNIQDRDGNTALMLSVRYDNQKIAEKLINYGANINISNKAGHDALMIAVYNLPDRFLTFRP